MKKTASFDTNQLIGKKFKYKGKYGLSEWTDIVKDVEFHHSIVFDKPLNLYVPKKGEDFKAEKLNIVGFNYNLQIRATRTDNVYEFENCIFVDYER
jgi:hypothetical protein